MAARRSSDDMPTGRRHLYSTPLPFQQHNRNSTSTDSTWNSLSQSSSEQRYQTYRPRDSVDNSSITTYTTDYGSTDGQSQEEKERRFPTGSGVDGMINALSNSDRSASTSRSRLSSEITQSAIRHPSSPSPQLPERVSSRPNKTHPVTRDGVGHLMREKSGVLIEQVDGVVLNTTANDHENTNNGRTIPEIEADDIRQIPPERAGQEHSNLEAIRARDHTAASPSPIGDSQTFHRPRQITPRPAQKPQTHVFVDRWASLPRRPNNPASPQNSSHLSQEAHHSPTRDTGELDSAEPPPITRHKADFAEPVPTARDEVDPAEPPPIAINKTTGTKPHRGLLERLPFMSKSHERESSASKSTESPTNDLDRSNSTSNASTITTPDMTPAASTEEDDSSTISSFMKAKIEESAQAIEEALPFNRKRKALNVTFSDYDNVKMMTPRGSTYYDER